MHDLNSDGFLDHTELRAIHHKGQGGAADAADDGAVEQLFLTFDADGDRLISAAEFHAATGACGCAFACAVYMCVCKHEHTGTHACIHTGLRVTRT